MVKADVVLWCTLARALLEELVEKLSQNIKCFLRGSYLCCIFSCRRVTIPLWIKGLKENEHFEFQERK